MAAKAFALYKTGLEPPDVVIKLEIPAEVAKAARPLILLADRYYFSASTASRYVRRERQVLPRQRCYERSSMDSEKVQPAGQRL
jgi:hypothetical protein